MNSEIIGKPTDASYGVVFLNPLSENIKLADPHEGLLDNRIKNISYKSIGKDTIIDGTTATAIDITVKTDRPLPVNYNGEIAYRISKYSGRYDGERNH